MEIHCPHDAMVSIKELKPHPQNRNKHPKEQIERLAKILDYQGWRYPIKVSKLSGFITSGHGRLEAARHLKLKEVPVSYQDYTDEAQEYADLQSDNAIASWAELDLSGINSDIVDLGPDFDLDLLGIKDFVLEPVEKLEPQCDEDEVPDALPEPKVVKGEVYVLGKHRLMCGDSTAITEVERLMDGKKADMVFTDPPYGYKYESNYQEKHKMLMNDDHILDFMPTAYAALADNGAAFVCGSHQTIHIWRPLFEQYFSYKNLIVWKKNNWSMGDLTGAFGGQHELILFGHKGRVELRGARSPDVWEFDRDPPKEHPTQKPIPMIEHAIEKVSDKGSYVLDLFGGSGSTLIACEKTDRQCFMMELDPHYCGVILDRWQKFTGKKAHREDGVAWDEIKAGVSDGKTA